MAAADVCRGNDLPEELNPFREATCIHVHTTHTHRRTQTHSQWAESLAFIISKSRKGALTSCQFLCTCLNCKWTENEQRRLESDPPTLGCTAQRKSAVIYVFSLSQTNIRANNDSEIQSTSRRARLQSSAQHFTGQSGLFRIPLSLSSWNQLISMTAKSHKCEVSNNRYTQSRAQPYLLI